MRFGTAFGQGEADPQRAEVIPSDKWGGASGGRETTSRAVFRGRIIFW